MVGVALARQYNLAALLGQLSAIRQWRDVWTGPHLKSLLKRWYDVFLKRIVFFMTICDKYSSRGELRSTANSIDSLHLCFVFLFFVCLFVFCYIRYKLKPWKTLTKLRISFEYKSAFGNKQEESKEHVTNKSSNGRNIFRERLKYLRAVIEERRKCKCIYLHENISFNYQTHAPLLLLCTVAFSTDLNYFLSYRPKQVGYQSIIIISEVM